MRRLSIAALMTVVLVCGLAAAALRDASQTWAGLLTLVTLGLLGFALLGILHRRGSARAFWQGFALFGWGYGVLAFGPWFVDQVQPKLPTTQLLGYLYGKLHPTPASGVQLAGTWGQAVTVNGNVFLTDTALTSAPQPTTASARWRVFALGGVVADPEPFQRVGQCLFALLAALVGGLASRTLERSQRRREGETSPGTAA
jgi:hypothetical protein